MFACVAKTKTAGEASVAENRTHLRTTMSTPVGRSGILNVPEAVRDRNELPSIERVPDTDEYAEVAVAVFILRFVDDHA